MQLVVRDRGIEVTGPLRAVIERRVEAALARLAPQARVHVTLADVNGPRGGRDKRVRVRVVADGRPPLVVEDDDRDVLCALDRAVDRAARTAVRDRERSPRRPPRPRLGVALGLRVPVHGTPRGPINRPA